MSGVLDGRVAIVTGAGRGLGRSHALQLAKHGASVVVNDLGCAVNGEDISDTPAASVVDEILESGGQAVISPHDVSDWQQAGELIELAISTFGNLHVLVNNAGILRDRSCANMTEQEWDAVIRVHLKGHAAPSHHAMTWWRHQSKSGAEVKASVVHTTSIAGLFPNFGQANYCSAKAAIIALSQVIALEGAGYGIRSNAVAPSARTRLFDSPAADGDAPDELDPSNVSRLIGWLAMENCDASGQTFHVLGNQLTVFENSATLHAIDTGEADGPGDFDSVLGDRLVSMCDARMFIQQRIGDHLM